MPALYTVHFIIIMAQAWALGRMYDFPFKHPVWKTCHEGFGTKHRFAYWSSSIYHVYLYSSLHSAMVLILWRMKCKHALVCKSMALVFLHLLVSKHNKMRYSIC